jgi:hypothetical protein
MHTIRDEGLYTVVGGPAADKMIATGDPKGQVVA